MTEGQIQTFPRWRAVTVESPMFPALFLGVMFFCSYLYPQHYFQYSRVIGASDHILISTLMITGIVGTVMAASHLIHIGEYAQTQFSFSHYLAFKGILILANLVSFAVSADAVYHLMNGVPPSAIREAVYPDFYGVSLLSVFPVTFIGPFVGAAVDLKRPWKRLIVISAVCAFLRGMATAERFAILEVLIVILLTLSLLKIVRVRWRYIVMIVLGVVVLFVVQEFIRDLAVRLLLPGSGGMTAAGAVAWSIERLFSYYGDVVNKFYYVYVNNVHSRTPYFLNGIREIFGKFSEPDGNTDNFMNYVWSEGFSYRAYTNPGGLTEYVLDFGLAGIIIFFIHLTVFCILYKLFKKKSVFGLAFYPPFYLSILELLRYNYLYESRFVGPAIGVSLVLLAFIIQGHVIGGGTAVPQAGRRNGC